MKIIDLNDNFKSLYFVCLEDWSEEAKEAGNHKEVWYNKVKDKGDKSETAKHIGEIFLKMLEKFTPDFDQQHIRSIVGFLYDAGATNNAKTICNTYGVRGMDFLKDIYEKHSKKA